MLRATALALIVQLDTNRDLARVNRLTLTDRLAATKLAEQFDLEYIVAQAIRDRQKGTS